MRAKVNNTDGIFPMPVLMIATYNEDGSVNVMTAYRKEHDEKTNTLSFLHTLAVSSFSIKTRRGAPCSPEATWF